MSNRLFLYGTIKTGQPNYSFLLDAAPERWRLVGTGKTETKWPLVITTKYNIPFLLDKEGEGHNVQGEVYEMDDELLADLDNKEGYPESYDRRKIRIAMNKMADGSEPKTIECWFYVLPRFRPSLLTLEHHECYDSYGAHGRQYIQVYDHEKKEWIEPYDIVHGEISSLRMTEGQEN